MAEERLQKLIARSGTCSRRQAEVLIAEGRVAVNGRVVRVLGTKADPLRDSVSVDGRELRREPLSYWMLHKPLGVICADTDPYGRACARMAVGHELRLHPIGRLDAATSGLMLFTNDGALAHDLVRSDAFATQGFDVGVVGRPDRTDLDRIVRGASRRGETVRLARVEPLDPGAGARLTWWQVEVADTASRRHLRWLFDAIGHPVMRLRRTRIGAVSIDGLPEGASRRLMPGERLELRLWRDSLAVREPVPAATP